MSIEPAQSSCILALDLGTSSFKCAAVQGGELVSEAVELPYEIDYSDGHAAVCDPEMNVALALTALKLGAENARNAGMDVRSIGICSQAQTFVGTNELGAAITPAVVWLDNSAVREAEELTLPAGDFSTRTGFPKPNPQMFMLKAIYDSLHGGALKSCHRILLLHEFIIMRLTGNAYGDWTQQGMGGFFDISSRKWNEDCIKLAGIKSTQLAETHPAAGFALPVLLNLATNLGISEVPVFSCGNDQCCSAIGAGLSAPGDVVCNFGTAMVVYTVRPDQPTCIKDDQIAGIDPLSGGYFLLGYESECGIAIDRAYKSLGTCDSIDEIIQNPDGTKTRAVLEQISDRFWRLLSDLIVSPRGARLVATGGLSRSKAWLSYLEQTHNVRFEKARYEHSSLLGVAAVIERHRN